MKIFIISLFSLLILTSCSLSKKVAKTNEAKDSIAVSTIDSNWLKKQLDEVKYSNKSGKETTYTITKDTVINNIYYPPQALPTHTIEYIQADGTQTKLSVDTGSYKKSDSLRISETKTTVNKEVKVKWPLTTWLLIGLVIYVFGKDILAGVIKLFKNKYQIVKL